MKNAIVFSIAFGIAMSACAPKSKHTSIHTRVVVPEDSLSIDKKLLLDSLKTRWLHESFDCLYAVDLKPDCGDLDAGGFSVALLVDIDSSGAVAHCEITAEDICGASRQKLHDINTCIVKEMSATILPPRLRDITLKFKMSRYVRS